MSTSCNFPGCPNKNTSPETVQLLTCARCKVAKYCSKECQKKAWVFHKIKCVPPEVPRHTVDGFTLDDIQRTIDQASPGDVVLLQEGKYEGSGGAGGTVTINKPLFLWGPKGGSGSVNFHGSLLIQPSGNGDSDEQLGINLVDFTIHGRGEIKPNTYKDITLCNINIRCPPEMSNRYDALFIGEGSGGKCLVLNCEIYGGSDGIQINAENVHIRDCEIRFASSRGIFANPSFVIQDTEISNCGGYGIKGRSGWDEKGNDNDIQPGPWSSFGGASPGFGGGW